MVSDLTRQKRETWQDNWPSILLSGGPQDGAIIMYPQPLPDIIVTASRSPALVYHQYSCHDPALSGAQKDAAIVSYTYHHQFTYRINELETMEVLG